jgi:hypothetical protein
MASNLRRRLEKVKAKAPKPKPDTRFEPWGPEGTREAWAAVGAAERERLWGAYQRCGGVHQPALVRRGPDGAWQLTTFNLPFGGVCYSIGQVWKELGHEAMIKWIAASCTEGEVKVFLRMMQSGWNADMVREGDVAILEGVVSRLPKWRPGSGGGRDGNRTTPANPESW